MCGYSCRDTTLPWRDIVHESTEKGDYAVWMLRRYCIQMIDEKDISIALYECDGNLAEAAQSLDTDTDTLSSYIKAFTALQRSYAATIDISGLWI